jgi:hypothetical protein
MNPARAVLLLAMGLLIAGPALACGASGPYLELGGALTPLQPGPIAFGGYSFAITPALRWQLELGLGPRPLPEQLVTLPEQHLDQAQFAPLLMMSTGFELTGPIGGGSRPFMTAMAGIAHTREGDLNVTTMTPTDFLSYTIPGRELWSGMIGGSLGMRGTPHGRWPAPRFSVRSAYLPGYPRSRWQMAATLGTGW